MSDTWIDQFIAAVKEVAFDIPAPNAYTPVLVELCLAAERIRAEENHRQEADQLRTWQEPVTQAAFPVSAGG